MRKFAGEFRLNEAAYAGTIFDYVPFTAVMDISRELLLVDGCWTYVDRDHFSHCGEDIVARRFARVFNDVFERRRRFTRFCAIFPAGFHLTRSGKKCSFSHRTGDRPGPHSSIRNKRAMPNPMPSARVIYNRLRLLTDLYRNSGHAHAPYQIVMLETTSICNLDCPICPVRRSENTMDRAAQQMKFEDVERIVALTRDITEAYCLNMWGEPALHKRFLDIVDHVSQIGRKIWFSTNLNYSERVAERLAANPLLHIVLSVDGWDKESYAEYRWGGRFDVVRRNMEILGKGRCTVYPQYLVDANAPDAEERRQHFLEFIQQTLGQTRTIIFKPKIENFRNAPGMLMPGRCSAMYAGLYFNCDGTLVPCCINVGKELRLRHVSSYTTEELHNSPEISSLRKRILTDKNQFSSCQTCAGYDHQTTIQNAIKSHLGHIFGVARSEPDIARQV